jgi:hypothetical protein
MNIKPNDVWKTAKNAFGTKLSNFEYFQMHSSWEADIRSASQKKNPRPLWNPKIQFCKDKSLSQVPGLIRINSPTSPLPGSFRYILVNSKCSWRWSVTIHMSVILNSRRWEILKITVIFIYFSVILPSTVRSPKWFLLFRSSNRQIK